MKLKSKVLLAQAPLGLIILIMCLLFIFTIGQIRLSTSSILEQNYKSISALENMRQSLDGLDNAAWSIMTSSYESKEEVVSAIDMNIKNFSEQLSIQKNNLEVQGEKENTDVLAKKWEQYSSDIKAIAARKDFVLSEKEYSKKIREEFTQIKESINLITELNQDEVFFRTEAINSMIKVVGQMIVVFTLATFLIGILASAMLTNKIMLPLSVLTRLVRDISNGKLGLKLDVSGNDEVAELGQEFNVMIKNLEEYRTSSIGEIVKAKQFLQMSIDTLPDPLFVFSPNMHVLNYNEAALRIFKLPTDAVFIDDIEEHFKERIKHIINYFVSHQVDSLPITLSKPIMLNSNEGVIELIPVAKPMVEAAHGLIGVSILFRNITNIDLKGYIKAERIITLTHELLSPLNSAQTAIHICLEKIIGDLTDKQVEFLSTAREDCFKVKHLITNLQDLDRLDTISSESKEESISLENIIRSAVQDIEVLAIANNIKVESELSHSIERITGNYDQLLLVFKNILDNAILHTPKGGMITIRMNEREKDVLCLIHNSGSYVPEEHRKKLFDKFFTVPSDEVKGDGIGLYIAKQIVLQHKGIIGVKSSKKLGTTFWIKLPKSL